MRSGLFMAYIDHLDSLFLAPHVNRHNMTAAQGKDTLYPHLFEGPAGQYSTM
jgi:hypothetical protein